MADAQITKEVNTILLEILDISESDIVPEASVMRDLKASSVNIVEIIAALENKFDLEIPDEDAAEMRSVQAIYDYVAAKKA